ncbi:hypothetical protein RRG08_022428 [Elysia crispata]|uniref:Uncharacterized protein n=1 Tax=Elysia crispata TaxID=231223 RepID=A0AAE0Z366_9GAST|nr:hypothetical protein RRG08_022428 [Elysia crispata]
MSRYSRPPNSSLYVRNVPDGTRIPSLKVKVQGKRMQMYNLAHSIQASDHARSCRKSWEGSSATFEDPRDADDALYHLDRTRYYGRELEIEFARGDRKTPGQMRGKERSSRRSPYSRYDDYDRSDRSRRRSRSRSPRYESPSRSSHRRRSRTASRSPRREARRSYTRSRTRSPSFERNREEERSRTRSKSRSPAKSDKDDREESPAE